MSSKPTLRPEEWVAFCDRHGQDPDDPDAFGATPPNRLARMIVEFRAVHVEVPFPCEDLPLGPST